MEVGGCLEAMVAPVAFIGGTGGGRNGNGSAATQHGNKEETKEMKFSRWNWGKRASEAVAAKRRGVTAGA